MITLFFAGHAFPAKAALVIGGLLLMTDAAAWKSERIYAEIRLVAVADVFAGLFIIVAGAQRALLTPEMVASVGGMRVLGSEVPILSAVTALLSNLVSLTTAGRADDEAVRRAAGQPRPPRGWNDSPWRPRWRVIFSVTWFDRESAV